MSTREEWLIAAGKLIYDTIISPVAVMEEGHSWAVSCGWPSQRALSKSARRLGECWGATACDDKRTHHIFISPALHEAVDGSGDGVLPTLVHELIHALGTTGHRGAFKRIALKVGLEGKMTATSAGKELSEKLARIAKRLGPYPHTRIDATLERKPQSTRLLKVEAVKCCGYVARVTRVWIEEQGLPKCPHGSRMKEV